MNCQYDDVSCDLYDGNLANLIRQKQKKIKGEKIQLIFKKNIMYYHKKKIKRKTPVMTLVTGVRVYRYLTSLPAEFLKNC